MLTTSAAYSIAARICSGFKVGYCASKSCWPMPAPSCLSTNSTVSRVPLKTGLPAINSLRSSTKSCHLIFMGSLQLLCLLRIALALIVLDTNPLPPAVTLEDFLAEDDFAMPVDERGEIARRLEVAAVGVVVRRSEQLLECI